uniref:Uncharacterized protein n=1 Tax=Helianthus annuus TaxID=4232 RepID=A0A251SKW5_HELAN
MVRDAGALILNPNHVEAQAAFITKHVFTLIGIVMKFMLGLWVIHLDHVKAQILHSAREPTSE